MQKREHQHQQQQGHQYIATNKQVGRSNCWVRGGGEDRYEPGRSSSTGLQTEQQQQQQQQQLHLINENGIKFRFRTHPAILANIPLHHEPRISPAPRGVATLSGAPSDSRLERLQVQTAANVNNEDSFARNNTSLGWPNQLRADSRAWQQHQTAETLTNSGRELSSRLRARAGGLGWQVDDLDGAQGADSTSNDRRSAWAPAGRLGGVKLAAGPMVGSPNGNPKMQESRTCPDWPPWSNETPTGPMSLVGLGGEPGQLDEQAAREQQLVVLRDKFEQFLEDNLEANDKLDLCYYLNEFETDSCNMNELLENLENNLFPRLPSAWIKCQLLKWIKLVFVHQAAAGPHSTNRGADSGGGCNPATPSGSSDSPRSTWRRPSCKSPDARPLNALLESYHLADQTRLAEANSQPRVWPRPATNIKQINWLGTGCKQAGEASANNLRPISSQMVSFAPLGEPTSASELCGLASVSQLNADHRVSHHKQARAGPPVDNVADHGHWWSRTAASEHRPAGQHPSTLCHSLYGEFQSDPMANKVTQQPPRNLSCASSETTATNWPPAPVGPGLGADGSRPGAPSASRWADLRGCRNQALDEELSLINRLEADARTGWSDDNVAWRASGKFANFASPRLESRPGAGLQTLGEARWGSGSGRPTQIKQKFNATQAEPQQQHHWQADTHRSLRRHSLPQLQRQAAASGLQAANVPIPTIAPTLGTLSQEASANMSLDRWPPDVDLEANFRQASELASLLSGPKVTQDRRLNIDCPRRPPAPSASSASHPLDNYHHHNHHPGRHYEHHQSWGNLLLLEASGGPQPGCRASQSPASQAHYSEDLPAERPARSWFSLDSLAAFPCHDQGPAGNPAAPSYLTSGPPSLPDCQVSDIIRRQRRNDNNNNNINNGPTPLGLVSKPAPATFNIHHWGPNRPPPQAPPERLVQGGPAAAAPRLFYQDAEGPAGYSSGPPLTIQPPATGTMPSNTAADQLWQRHDRESCGGPSGTGSLATWTPPSRHASSSANSDHYPLPCASCREDPSTTAASAASAPGCTWFSRAPFDPRRSALVPPTRCLSSMSAPLDVAAAAAGGGGAGTVGQLHQLQPPQVGPTSSMAPRWPTMGPGQWPMQAATAHSRHYEQHHLHPISTWSLPSSPIDAGQGRHHHQWGQFHHQDAAAPAHGGHRQGPARRNTAYLNQQGRPRILVGEQQPLVSKQSSESFGAGNHTGRRTAKFASSTSQLIDHNDHQHQQPTLSKQHHPRYTQDLAKRSNSGYPSPRRRSRRRGRPHHNSNGGLIDRENHYLAVHQNGYQSDSGHLVHDEQSWSQNEEQLDYDDDDDEDPEEPETECISLVPRQAKGRLPISVAEQMSEQANNFVQMSQRQSSGSSSHRSSSSVASLLGSRQRQSQPNHLASSNCGASGPSRHLSAAGVAFGAAASNQSAATKPNLQVRRTLRVRIKKTKPILGIAIEGGFNVSGQLLPRIVCVHEEGAAYQCGKLRASDLILEINGLSTVNMTHDDIARTIATAYYQDDRPYIEFLIGESIHV